MKRLMIMAAAMALSAGTFAEEPAQAAQKPAEAAATATPVAGEARRPSFDRARFEARMRERQAERRVKVAALLKGAGVPDDKVQSLTDEIDNIYSRPRPRRVPGKMAEGAPGRAGMRPQPHRRPQPAEPAKE